MALPLMVWPAKTPVMAAPAGAAASPKPQNAMQTPTTALVNRRAASRLDPRPTSLPNWRMVAGG
jgi:hypothetical protein